MRPLLLFALFLAAGCDSADDPVITPPPGPPQLGAATYEVAFTSTWSAETHSTDFPGDAHYSKLVGAVHPPSASLFSVGEVASDGIKDMAERGDNDALEAEIMAMGDEIGYIDGPRLSVSPDAATHTFTADVTFGNTAVTLVSMLAPSPDWFVGVEGLRLIEDGLWREVIVASLVVYDAGTDGGESYTAANAPLGTRQPIAVSDHTYFEGDRGEVGTLTFRLLEVEEADGE